MRLRTFVLAAGAALLAAVPVVVAGQQAPVSMKAGDKDAPRFVGGSGKTIPGGAVEIVQSGSGASFAPSGGATAPLGDSLGRILEGVGGALFSGPGELAVRGGVSFFVPEGSVVEAEVGPTGNVTFKVVKGKLYARNRDAVLMIGQGGGVGSTPSGRFTGLSGEGEASRTGSEGTETVGFSGTGAMEDIQRMFYQVTIFEEMLPTQGAVSSSEAFR